MKIDLYTKVVLTVIAACLVVLTVRGIFPIKEAHAADKGDIMQVDIVAVGGEEVPVSYESTRDGAKRLPYIRVK